MASRSRKPVEYHSHDPRDVVHVPFLSPASAEETPARPGGETLAGNGDHETGDEPGDAQSYTVSRGPGSDTSNMPRPTSDRETVQEAAWRTKPTLPEKTLHELNLEAREIDRWHARKREEAQAVARETLEPLLAGIMRPRQIPRRLQKSLRAPVRE
jgi:hypothetical protein